MNTQKSVYNRLFSKEEKTELETHKVELGGLSSEITEGYQEGFEALNKAIKEIQSIDTSKIKSHLKKSRSEHGVVIAKFDKMKKLSKELGIPVPKPVSKAGKLAEKMTKEWEKWNAIADKLESLSK